MSLFPQNLRRAAGADHLALAVGAGLFAAVNAWYFQKMRKAGKEFSLHAKHLYNFDTLIFPSLLAGAAPFLSPRGRGTALTAAAVLAAARVYATHVEPKILRVHHVRIRSSKTTRPVRLLHITDMETDAVRNQEPKVIRRARELRPDIVFHTGDLLAPVAPATYESELPKMAEVWSELEPPLGKFAVAGEVDRPIMSRLKQCLGGLCLLDGQSRLTEAAGLRLNVLGLTFEQSYNDDPQELRDTVLRWLSQAAPDDFTLLVGHRPDYILTVKDLPIDLCLAGHTHGGQVRVPLLGPIRTNSTVPDEWSVGFHEIGRTRLNVSAGVGFEHGNGFPAVRVNCPPEMTLFEILPEGEDS